MSDRKWSSRGIEWKMRRQPNSNTIVSARALGAFRSAEFEIPDWLAGEIRFLVDAAAPDLLRERDEARAECERLRKLIAEVAPTVVNALIALTGADRFIARKVGSKNEARTRSIAELENLIPRLPVKDPFDLAALLASEGYKGLSIALTSSALRAAEEREGGR